MQIFRFTVRQPNGLAETLDVESDRVLVGSGPHCDIRLPVEVAAWEHLVLTLEGDSAMARVVPTDASAMLDGAWFREAALREGAAIGLEGVTIEVRFAVGSTAAKGKKKPGGGPFTVALLALFPVLVLFALNRTDEEQHLKAPESVPDVLAAPVNQCPASNRAQALVMAEEKLALAESKRERWKFYVEDGVESVALFETAAVCFSASGDLRAGESSVVARGMRNAIDEEFRSYRLRLERALVRNDAQVGLLQVRLLSGMLARQSPDNEYVRWLGAVKRKLESQV